MSLLGLLGDEEDADTIADIESRLQAAQTSGGSGRRYGNDRRNVARSMMLIL